MLNFNFCCSVANATADLLMMGAWSAALDLIQAEQIPVRLYLLPFHFGRFLISVLKSYYFARDDRVYKAFVDRLDDHKVDIQRALSRRLKWQLRVLRTALEGRTTTYRVRSHFHLIMLMRLISFHGVNSSAK
jgi:hypothetical protein